MKQKAVIALASVAALILLFAGYGAATHTSVIEEIVVPWTIGDETGEVTITDTDVLPHETVTVTETTTSPPQPPPTCSAWKADYYEGQPPLTGVIQLTRCETAINNNWGNGSPAPSIQSDNFSARWVGTFNFNASDYRFTVRADDGVRLYVDGVRVINQWIAQSPTTYTVTRTITAGAHGIMVEYFENGGGAVMEASWAVVTVPQCSNGVNDDPAEDTLIDLADPGCTSASDTSESPNPPPPQTGFPNASNTGPTGTLTNVSGNLTITTAGTVIQNQNRTGCINVQANNVTIRNSEIHCVGSDYAIEHLNGNTGLLLEDLLVECGVPNGSCITGTSAFTLRRSEVFGGENLVWVEENSLIEDNYIHDPEPYDPATDPHTDGIQMPSTTVNVTLLHNTIYGGYLSQQNFGNSAITTGVSVNVRVLNNLLAGGGHTLRCPAEHDTDLQWHDNRFSRIFVSTVGGFGPIDGNCQFFPNSGNVYHETGLPIPLG